MVNFRLTVAFSLFATLSLIYPATGTFWRSNHIKLGVETLSHFQFYWHDKQSGANPTFINIIKRPSYNASLTIGFGIVNMIDDPLTEKPQNNSKLLGRAQGFYGLASQEELRLLMAMNFVFLTGRYNGSTLTVLGRNPVFHKVREMAVIGGTGLFRFARGYVQARTYSLNMPIGDAIVKYDVYVLHH